MHAIMDKKMDERKVVHCSKDAEKVEWNILDFKKRNLVAGEYVDLICKIGIKTHNIIELDLSNSTFPLER